MTNSRIAERGIFEGMVGKCGKFERSLHESAAKSREVLVGKKVVDVQDSDSDEDKKKQVTTRGATLMLPSKRARHISSRGMVCVITVSIDRLADINEYTC